MNILILEDDYISRKLLKALLKPFGECVLAVNGLEGLDFFYEAFKTNNRFDLILIDIMMPEMNGQDVLLKIREFEKENNLLGLDVVKTIMVTTLKDVDNIKKAFLHQCDGYIPKPIDRNKLLETLIKIDLLSKESI